MFEAYTRHTLSLLLLALLVAGAAEAVSCNCNNGAVAQSTPVCYCDCVAGYQLPSCDYKLTEDVRLDIYLLYPVTEFQSYDFVQKLAKGLTMDPTTISFRQATDLPKFNRTNVLLTMPGYGVKRFLPDVKSQAVYVQALSIANVYVIPIPPAPASQTNKYPLFDVQGYRITVDLIMYLVAAFIIVFILCVVEACCLFQNDEEVIHLKGYKGPVESPMDKYGAGSGGLDHRDHEQDRSSKPVPQ
jgi:hypothetical protein